MAGSGWVRFDVWGVPDGRSVSLSAPVTSNHRAARVISVLRSMHGGRDYVSEFGIRQRGTGPYAAQIATRFRLACKRLGINERSLKLRTDLFTPPVPQGGQMRLL